MFPRAQKFLAAFLAVIYFTTQVALGSIAEANFWGERRAANPNNKAQNPKELFNSKLGFQLDFGLGSLDLNQFGSIRKVVRPKVQNSKSKIIVHIQDIHMNNEAQQNIGKAVGQLIAQGPVKLLALEGAFGPIDFQRYRAFPKPDLLHKLVDYLLKENKISGPVHTAFTTAASLPGVLGVDDEFHYNANVEAVKQSLPLAANAKRALARKKRALAEKKDRIFNSALLQFDGQVQAYWNEQRGMGEHVKALLSHTQSFSPNCELFAEALQLEAALDMARVETERTRLTEALLARLPKAKTDELMALSLAYRSGQISHGDFYRVISKLCEAHGVSLHHFPAMQAYLRYTLVSGQIDAEKLFTEIRALEESVYGTLARTDEEKALVAESRQMFLKGKLLDFALTKEEWSEIKLSALSYPLSAELRSFESFYSEAEVRDNKMAENFLIAADSCKLKADSLSVLVTGGFHSAGITRVLSDAGYTVVTFVPKITKIDSADGASYLSVFTQEKTPLAQLFKGEKLFLAPRVMDGIELVDEFMDGQNDIPHSIFYNTALIGARVINGISVGLFHERISFLDGLDKKIWFKILGVAAVYLEAYAFLLLLVFDNHEFGYRIFYVLDLLVLDYFLGYLARGGKSLPGFLRPLPLVRIFFLLFYYVGVSYLVYFKEINFMDLAFVTVFYAIPAMLLDALIFSIPWFLKRLKVYPSRKEDETARLEGMIRWAQKLIVTGVGYQRKDPNEAAPLTASDLARRIDDLKRDIASKKKIIEELERKINNPVLDLTDLLASSHSKWAKSNLAAGGRIKGLLHPGGASLTVEQYLNLSRFSRKSGFFRLFSLRVQPDGSIESSTKALTDEEKTAVAAYAGARIGDIVFFISGPENEIDEHVLELQDHLWAELEPEKWDQISEQSELAKNDLREMEAQLKASEHLLAVDLPARDAMAVLLPLVKSIDPEIEQRFQPMPENSEGMDPKKLERLSEKKVSIIALAVPTRLFWVDMFNPSGVALPSLSRKSVFLSTELLRDLNLNDKEMLRWIALKMVNAVRYMDTFANTKSRRTKTISAELAQAQQAFEVEKWAGGYLTPRVRWNHIRYGLQDKATNFREREKLKNDFRILWTTFRSIETDRGPRRSTARGIQETIEEILSSPSNFDHDGNLDREEVKRKHQDKRLAIVAFNADLLNLLYRAKEFGGYDMARWVIRWMLNIMIVDTGMFPMNTMVDLIKTLVRTRDYELMVQALRDLDQGKIVATVPWSLGRLYRHFKNTFYWYFTEPWHLIRLRWSNRFVAMYVYLHWVLTGGKAGGKVGSGFSKGWNYFTTGLRTRVVLPVSSEEAQNLYERMEIIKFDAWLLSALGKHAVQAEDDADRRLIVRMADESLRLVWGIRAKIALADLRKKIRDRRVSEITYWLQHTPPPLFPAIRALFGEAEKVELWNVYAFIPNKHAEFRDEGFRLLWDRGMLPDQLGVGYVLSVRWLAEYQRLVKTNFIDPGILLQTLRDKKISFSDLVAGAKIPYGAFFKQYKRNMRAEGRAVEGDSSFAGPISKNFVSQLTPLEIAMRAAFGLYVPGLEDVPDTVYVKLDGEWWRFLARLKQFVAKNKRFQPIVTNIPIPTKKSYQHWEEIRTLLFRIYINLSPDSRAAFINQITGPSVDIIERALRSLLNDGVVVSLPPTLAASPKPSSRPRGFFFMEKTFHLPLAIWKSFKNRIIEAYDNGDGELHRGPHNRIVLQGLGVGRTDEQGKITIERDALPYLSEVLNEALGRSPPNEITEADVLDFIQYHESKHKKIKSLPPFLPFLLDGLRNPALYDPRSSIDGFEKLKITFANNYGDRYLDDSNFAEELLVVFLTEQNKLGQNVRLVLDPARPKDRRELPKPVADFLRKKTPIDLLDIPSRARLVMKGLHEGLAELGVPPEMRTVGALTERTVEEVRWFPGIGKTSLEAVQAALRPFGVQIEKVEVPPHRSISTKIVPQIELKGLNDEIAMFSYLYRYFMSLNIEAVQIISATSRSANGNARVRRDDLMADLKNLRENIFPALPLLDRVHTKDPTQTVRHFLATRVSKAEELLYQNNVAANVVLNQAARFCHAQYKSVFKEKVERYRDNLRSGRKLLRAREGYRYFQSVYQTYAVGPVQIPLKGFQRRTFAHLWQAIRAVYQTTNSEMKSWHQAGDVMRQIDEVRSQLKAAGLTPEQVQILREKIQAMARPLRSLWVVDKELAQFALQTADGILEQGDFNSAHTVLGLSRMLMETRRMEINLIIGHLENQRMGTLNQERRDRDAELTVIAANLKNAFESSSASNFRKAIFAMVEEFPIDVWPEPEFFGVPVMLRELNDAHNRRDAALVNGNKKEVAAEHNRGLRIASRIESRVRASDQVHGFVHSFRQLFHDLVVRESGSLPLREASDRAFVQSFDEFTRANAVRNGAPSMAWWFRLYPFVFERFLVENPRHPKDRAKKIPNPDFNMLAVLSEIIALDRVKKVLNDPLIVPSGPLYDFLDSHEERTIADLMASPEDREELFAALTAMVAFHPVGPAQDGIDANIESLHRAYALWESRPSGPGVLASHTNTRVLDELMELPYFTPMTLLFFAAAWAVTAMDSPLFIMLLLLSGLVLDIVLVAWAQRMFVDLHQGPSHEAYRNYGGQLNFEEYQKEVGLAYWRLHKKSWSAFYYVVLIGSPLTLILANAVSVPLLLLITWSVGLIVMAIVNFTVHYRDNQKFRRVGPTPEIPVLLSHSGAGYSGQGPGWVFDLPRMKISSIIGPEVTRLMDFYEPEETNGQGVDGPSGKKKKWTKEKHARLMKALAGLVDRQRTHEDSFGEKYDPRLYHHVFSKRQEDVLIGDAFKHDIPERLRILLLNILILFNVAIKLKIAMKNRKNGEDAFQEMVLRQLLRSDTYDPYAEPGMENEDNSFLYITYIYRGFGQSSRDADNQERVLHVPLKLFSLRNHITRVMIKLFHEMGRRPSFSEIAEESNRALLHDSLSKSLGKPEIRFLSEVGKLRVKISEALLQTHGDLSRFNPEIWIETVKTKTFDDAKNITGLLRKSVLDDLQNKGFPIKRAMVREASLFNRPLIMVYIPLKKEASQKINRLLLSSKQVEDVLLRTRPINSASSLTATNQKGNEKNEFDNIPAEISDPVEAVQAQQEQELAAGVIDQLLGVLKPREVHVLRYRYGLNKTNERKSGKEIADELKISKQAVSDLHKRALDKLRRYIPSQPQLAGLIEVFADVEKGVSGGTCLFWGWLLQPLRQSGPRGRFVAGALESTFVPYAEEIGTMLFALILSLWMPSLEALMLARVTFTALHLLGPPRSESPVRNLLYKLAVPTLISVIPFGIDPTLLVFLITHMAFNFSLTVLQFFAGLFGRTLPLGKGVLELGHAQGLTVVDVVNSLDAALVRAKFAEAGETMEVSFSSPRDLPRITADPHQLAVLWENALGGIIDSQATRLAISAGVEGPSVRVDFRSDGKNERSSFSVHLPWIPPPADWIYRNPQDYPVVANGLLYPNDLRKQVTNLEDPRQYGLFLYGGAVLDAKIVRRAQRGDLHVRIIQESYPHGKSFYTLLSFIETQPGIYFPVVRVRGIFVQDYFQESRTFGFVSNRGFFRETVKALASIDGFTWISDSEGARSDLNIKAYVSLEKEPELNFRYSQERFIITKKILGLILILTVPLLMGAEGGNVLWLWSAAAVVPLWVLFCCMGTSRGDSGDGRKKRKLSLTEMVEDLQAGGPPAPLINELGRRLYASSEKGLEESELANIIAVLSRGFNHVTDEEVKTDFLKMIGGGLTRLKSADFLKAKKEGIHFLLATLKRNHLSPALRHETISALAVVMPTIPDFNLKVRVLKIILDDVSHVRSANVAFISEKLQLALKKGFDERTLRELFANLMAAVPVESGNKRRVIVDLLSYMRYELHIEDTWKGPEFDALVRHLAKNDGKSREDLDPLLDLLLDDGVLTRLDVDRIRFATTGALEVLGVLGAPGPDVDSDLLSFRIVPESETQIGRLSAIPETAHPLYFLPAVLQADGVAYPLMLLKGQEIPRADFPADANPLHHVKHSIKIEHGTVFKQAWEPQKSEGQIEWRPVHLLARSFTADSEPPWVQVNPLGYSKDLRYHYFVLNGSQIIFRETMDREWQAAVSRKADEALRQRGGREAMAKRHDRSLLQKKILSGLKEWLEEHSEFGREEILQPFAMPRLRTALYYLFQEFRGIYHRLFFKNKIGALSDEAIRDKFDRVAATPGIFGSPDFQDFLEVFASLNRGYAFPVWGVVTTQMGYWLILFKAAHLLQEQGKGAPEWFRSVARLLLARERGANFRVSTAERKFGAWLSRHVDVEDEGFLLSDMERREAIASALGIRRVFEEGEMLSRLDVDFVRLERHLFLSDLPLRDLTSALKIGAVPVLIQRPSSREWRIGVGTTIRHVLGSLFSDSFELFKVQVLREGDTVTPEEYERLADFALRPGDALVLTSQQEPPSAAVHGVVLPLFFFLSLPMLMGVSWRIDIPEFFGLLMAPFMLFFIVVGTFMSRGTVASTPILWLLEGRPDLIALFKAARITTIEQLLERTELPKKLTETDRRWLVDRMSANRLSLKPKGASDLADGDSLIRLLLPAKTLDLLDRKNIKTVGDLTNKSWHDLFLIFTEERFDQLVAWSALSRVEQALAEHHLRLRQVPNTVLLATNEINSWPWNRNIMQGKALDVLLNAKVFTIPDLQKALGRLETLAVKRKSGVRQMPSYVASAVRKAAKWLSGLTGAIQLPLLLLSLPAIMGATWLSSPSLSDLVLMSALLVFAFFSLKKLGKFFRRQSGSSQYGAQRSRLDGAGTMNRNDRAVIELDLVTQDGMTAALPEQNKARFLKSPDGAAARDLGQVRHQAAMSLMRTSFFWRDFLSFARDHKYSLMAFLMFFMASAMVSPWLAQPGNAGAYMENPPPVSSSTTTLYFMSFFLFFFKFIGEGVLGRLGGVYHSPVDVSKLEKASKGDEASSALSWPNIFAGLLVVIGMGIYGDHAYQSLVMGLVYCASSFLIALTAFFLHEEAHRRDAGLRWRKDFKRVPGLVFGGLGFPNARGEPGIRWSLRFASLSALVAVLSLYSTAPWIVSIRPLLLAAIAFNLIAAGSFRDLSDVRRVNFRTWFINLVMVAISGLILGIHYRETLLPILFSHHTGLVIAGAVAALMITVHLGKALIKTPRRRKIERVDQLSGKYFRQYGTQAPEFLLEKPSTIARLAGKMVGHFFHSMDLVMHALFALYVFALVKQLWKVVRWILAKLTDDEPHPESHGEIIRRTRWVLRWAETRAWRRGIMHWWFLLQTGGYVWAESAMRAYHDDPAAASDLSRKDYMGLRERLIEPLADYLFSKVRLRGHLHNAKDIAIVHFLMDALSDKDPYVVKAAARGLGELAPWMDPFQRDQICGEFIRLIEHGDLEVAKSAGARGLKKIPSHGALRDAVRILGNHAKGRVRDTDWHWIESYLIDAIELLIHSHHISPRRFAGYSELQDLLIRKTSDKEDLLVRVSAMKALARLHDLPDKSIEALSTVLLNDSNAAVQETALWALGHIFAANMGRIGPEKFIRLLENYATLNDRRRRLQGLQAGPLTAFAENLLHEFSRDGVGRAEKRRIARFLKRNARPFQWNFAGSLRLLLRGRRWFSKLFELSNRPGKNPDVFLAIDPARPPSEEELAALQKQLDGLGINSILVSDYYQERTHAHASFLPEKKGELDIRLQTGFLTQVISSLGHNKPTRLRRRDQTRGGDTSERFAGAAQPRSFEPFLIIGFPNERDQLTKPLGRVLPMIPLPVGPNGIDAGAVLKAVKIEAEKPVVYSEDVTRLDRLKMAAARLRARIDQLARKFISSKNKKDEGHAFGNAGYWAGWRGILMAAVGNGIVGALIGAGLYLGLENAWAAGGVALFAAVFGVVVAMKGFRALHAVYGNKTIAYRIDETPPLETLEPGVVVPQKSRRPYFLWLRNDFGTRRGFFLGWGEMMVLTHEMSRSHWLGMLAMTIFPLAWLARPYYRSAFGIKKAGDQREMARVIADLWRIERPSLENDLLGRGRSELAAAQQNALDANPRIEPVKARVSVGDIFVYAPRFGGDAAVNDAALSQLEQVVENATPANLTLIMLEERVWKLARIPREKEAFVKVIVSRHGYYRENERDVLNVKHILSQIELYGIAYKRAFIGRPTDIGFELPVEKVYDGRVYLISIEDLISRVLNGALLNLRYLRDIDKIARKVAEAA